MKSDFRWIVLDTETDGFRVPVHALEISAQLMVGWNPVGNPFRVLINHDIDIDYESMSIHGYNREFLGENGIKPLDAHSKLRDYVKDYPIVSHNLNFDWDRVLLSEWGRLGIPQIGRRGFCSLLLSKRVIPEVDSYKLDELKKHFGINTGTSHRADSDVATLVELMSSIIAPRLSRLSIDTFERVQSFSKKDIKACHEVLRSINVVSGRKSIINKSDVRDVDAKSEMASERQVLYLRWLGVPDTHLLTAKKAKYLINTRGGLYSVRHDISEWARERLILYPDVFRQELLEYLSGKLLRDCIDYFHEHYFDSSLPLDGKIAKDVINNLQSIDSKWWQSKNFKDIFLEKLKTEYPGCCDGKSVYFNKVLPQILLNYGRNKTFKPSERLDVDKVLKVMQMLSNKDLNWHKNSDFKKLFYETLQSAFPACCDGHSAESRRMMIMQKKVDNISKAKKEIDLQLSLATEGDAFAQYKLGMAKLAIGRLCKESNSIEEALEWLEKSALRGNQLAQLEIAFSIKNYHHFQSLETSRWVNANGWLKFCYHSNVPSISHSGISSDSRSLIYHIARPGEIVGKYSISELYNCLQNGSLSYDNFYWISGMGQDWRKLSEIKTLIETPNCYQVVNGGRRYDIDVFPKKILREINRIENLISEDSRNKSQKKFIDLCLHFKIAPSK